MKIYQVDSFANEIFKGNPAAVCILENSNYEDIFLQNVAMEMNLSETAFLKKVSSNEYNLRWFTPEVEVELCGHATLASAFVLWEKGIVEKSETICFNTLSGILKAKYYEGWIELDLPRGFLKKSEGDKNLISAFEKKPLNVYEDELYYLLEYENEKDVLEMNPDLSILKNARKKEIIVTSKSEKPEYDFISRFFAPAIGINEDPVTGSAHCLLTPFWKEKLNKSELIALQASKRTGVLKCSMDEKRVFLKGKAIIVMEGEIII